MKKKAIIFLLSLFVILSVWKSEVLAATSGNESAGEIILNLLADYVNIPIGDIFQSMLDRTGTALTEKEADKILYEVTELKDTSNKFYNEINLIVYNENIGTNTNDNTDTGTKINDNTDTKTIKSVPIKSSEKNKNGKSAVVFDASTKIPIIPVDVYSISTTNMGLFDIDFISSNNNNGNKIWKFYRNIVSSVSHAVLYICAALLIGMIITRAILIVISTNTNNVKVVEKSKRIMDDLVQAIIYIVGAYLIVAVMNNFYKVMISFITENATNFPLRAEVENIYSFNTNIVGLVRYKTQSSNIGTKFGYSILYLLTVGLNMVWFLAMFIRNFLLGIVVMIAPITGIKKVMGEDAKESIFQFKGWLKFYSIVLWIPSFVIIIMSLFLRFSGGK